MVPYCPRKMAAMMMRQLGTMVQDIESRIAGLSDVSFTTDELNELDALGGRLAAAAVTVQTKTGSFRPSHAEKAWKASEKLRSQAVSSTAALIRDGKLNRAAVFGRNIITIFTGPRLRFSILMK